jgi:hypothetical protein
MSVINLIKKYPSVCNLFFQICFISIISYSTLLPQNNQTAECEQSIIDELNSDFYDNAIGKIRVLKLCECIPHVDDAMFNDEEEFWFSVKSIYYRRVNFLQVLDALVGGMEPGAPGCYPWLLLNDRAQEFITRLESEGNIQIGSPEYFDFVFLPSEIRIRYGDLSKVPNIFSYMDNGRQGELISEMSLLEVLEMIAKIDSPYKQEAIERIKSLITNPMSKLGKLSALFALQEIIIESPELDDLFMDIIINGEDTWTRAKVSGRFQSPRKRELYKNLLPVDMGEIKSHFYYAIVVKEPGTKEEIKYVLDCLANETDEELIKWVLWRLEYDKYFKPSRPTTEWTALQVVQDINLQLLSSYGWIPENLYDQLESQLTKIENSINEPSICEIIDETLEFLLMNENDSWHLGHKFIIYPLLYTKEKLVDAGFQCN